MSASHTPAEHDSHASPAPSALKKIVTLALLVGLPLVVIFSLVGNYTAQDSGAGVSTMTEEAVTARIQKIGFVALGDSKRELKNGEEVFKAQCGTCHTAGLLGAPKFSDQATWAPRIATGYGALLNSALKGKNAMTAQGGGAFSDYEIGRAVVYMANAAGAKFDEPKAPADAVGTPAAAASATK